MYTSAFLLPLLPSLSQFNDEQKFLARMEILKATCQTATKFLIRTPRNPDLPFQTQSVSCQTHRILQPDN